MRAITRDKIKVTATLVVLIMVLIVGQRATSSGLKRVMFIQNDITALEEYVISDEVSYMLPTKWVSNEMDYTSSGIIYYNTFTDIEESLSGYVQVVKSNDDEEDFLKNNRSAAEKNNRVSEYNYQPIEVNSQAGYLVTYKMSNESTSQDMQVHQYVFNQEDEYTTFSFHVGSDRYDSNYTSIYTGIIETLERKLN